ncbi:MAG: CoA-binding protein [Methanocella sp.]
MSEEQVTEILNKYRVIAIVGASNTIGKPSHRVAAYLKQHGYKIIPINPNITELFGEKSYKSLLDVPPQIQATIDVVDIFRKSEDVPPIVDQVIELKQRTGRPFVVWMQQDIVNEGAAEKARQAGLVVVMDKCLMKEHLHRR